MGFCAAGHMEAPRRSHTCSRMRSWAGMTVRKMRLSGSRHWLKIAEQGAARRSCG